MSWNYGPDVAFRRERHFDDRVMACIAQRPSGPYEAFERAVAARPDAEAVVAGDQRLTYAALNERVVRAAGGLAERGVGAGDRVALLLGNRVEFVTTLLATLRLGAIAVPMGTRLQGPEIAYIVQHSGACAIVHDAELASRLPAAADAPQLRLRASAGGPADGSERYEALEDSRVTSAVHSAPEEAVAVILYTSGTTGRPKGAMLTRLNLVHSMLNYVHSMKIGPHDRTLMAVPASHVTGLVANVMLAWAAQCTLVVMAEFKARAFLELAARERMTHTIIVPAMYSLCLLQTDFDRFDLSAWRAGGYGGAPMAEATIAALAKQLPGLGLHNCYGSTETTSPATILPARFAAERPDSVGFALPGAEIVVMDEFGREVPRGTSGELWIRGPMVVPGYWNNPEATKKGFVAGYWLSGDIGSIDEQGFVRVFDRAKDMLNRGGFKIYSVEVENVLLEHPAVVESAIVGRPDPVLGERVHAFVCVRPDAAVQADELKRLCAERLADYKVPETVTLTTTPLPRNANGKLLKRELRQRLLEREPPN
ncbi:MAG TPA: AMP-binding protein [Burkholderiaceae bacterium]|nr:AMP-binding protein [Burkholderiaceae bacterium]